MTTVKYKISEGSIPSLSESELDKVFGKILSVIKIQSGNEIPDRINVNKIVFKLSLMVSITSPFITKIATPASPTSSPRNMYLSKSKPIAA